MNIEFDPKSEIKEFLYNRREILIAKTPSIYYLEAYADKLLDIVNRWQSQSNETVMPLIRIRYNLNIFKADLTELEHDYDKGNKRYRGKWLAEKEKIDNIKDKLITTYDDSKKIETSE